MLIIDSTTDSIRLSTSSAATINYHVSYAEFSTSNTFALGESNGSIASATTTTILSAPASTYTRQVKHLSIVNTSGNTDNTVVVMLTVSGTDRYLWRAILKPGDGITYNADDGWQMLNPQVGFPVVYEPRTSREFNWKWADAYEANTMTNYFQAALAITRTQEPRTADFNTAAITASRTFDGTSHLSGRTWATVNGSESWLDRFDGVSANRPFISILFDFLSSGTSLVATTTTAQTATTAALPARDLHLSTNGVGVIPILYCAATSTNVARSGMTMSYTNQAGTAGRTASQIATTNASLAPGVFHMFSLQAGDTGVRSVETVTFGATLASGTWYVILVKPMTGTNVLSSAGPSGTVRSLSSFGVKLLGTEMLVPAMSHLGSGTSTTHQESVNWRIKYV
jgi:hypothetical protein